MSYYSFYRPTEGKRLSRTSWQASQAVTHRSTNWAWRRVMSFQPKHVTNYATPPASSIRSSTSADTFCRLLKTHCFQQAYYSPSRLSQVPQIRPLADIVHFKYARIYLLTYLLIPLSLSGGLAVWTAKTSVTGRPVERRGIG